MFSYYYIIIYNIIYILSDRMIGTRKFRYLPFDAQSTPKITKSLAANIFTKSLLEKYKILVTRQNASVKD